MGRESCEWPVTRVEPAGRASAAATPDFGATAATATATARRPGPGAAEANIPADQHNTRVDLTRNEAMDLTRDRGVDPADGEALAPAANGSVDVDRQEAVAPSRPGAADGDGGASPRHTGATGRDRGANLGGRESVPAGAVDSGQNETVDLGRVAWLVTVAACLIAVLILVFQGYYGYAAVTFAVAVAAAINLF